MSTSAPSIHNVSPANVSSAAIPARAAVVHETSVAWYIWFGVLAVTSSAIGGAWDVSWHRSIGRDSFLTPAHIAIYACGVIAAVICGYLIFATTFGHSAKLRDVSVNVLGFRAPLGAFIAAWGGIAMLTSAPFDNWWHAAYGLDVKIVSPPHTLLILGIRAVVVGVMFLILAAMNRASIQANTHAANDPRARATYLSLRRLFLYLGGLVVIGQMFFLFEFTQDVELHSTLAYITMAIAMPVTFAVVARACGHRWTCTITAAIYMAFTIAEILILPLFPATPKLGPVFFPVTHMVPANFPVLLIIPALALDLLWQRTRAWKPWHIAVLSGLLFTLLLVAVEWPFAAFLLSKASENRFFGTTYFGYYARPDNFLRLRLWYHPAAGVALARGLAWASLFAMIGTWIGLRFGAWMKTVQR
jgi:hypothetical protein